MSDKAHRRLKDLGALGLVAVETALMFRLASGSDGALQRAGRNALLGASAASLVGGVVGFVVGFEDEETLEATATLSAIAAAGGGLLGGVASLTWEAFQG